MARLVTDVQPGDAEISVYLLLNRRQLKQRDLFICESLPAIESALEAGITPVSFLMEKRHVTGKAARLLERLPDIDVYAPGDEVIKDICGMELSRGVLCAMKRPPEKRPEDVLTGAKRVAVLEDVRDDTNMGAIFRNAAALGMDALLLTRGSADPYSRRSVRVSMGAVFRLPFAFVPAADASFMALLRQSGFERVALALKKDSVEIGAVRAEKIAFFLGNEGEGLKEETVGMCDKCAVIPMARGVDSLNVATAAAIAFYLSQK